MSHPWPHEPPLKDIDAQAQAFLGRFKFPQESFAPEENWKQAWTIALPTGLGECGTLELNKTRRADGTFDLMVDWRVLQSAGATQHLEATVHCAADDLATPIEWQAQSEMLKHGRPIPHLTVKQQVKVNQGVLEVDGAGRRLADQPLGAWTSNWSLLEAIPRMNEQAFKPLNFTLLDYLDEPKEGQALADLGTLEMVLGGKKTKLHGCQLVGHGIMPMEYWLDEQGRVMVFLGRNRCLLATAK